MTENRTVIDVFAAFGTKLMVVLLVVLAVGVSVTEYIATARDRMRRVEGKLRRRAARRVDA